MWARLISAPATVGDGIMAFGFGHMGCLGCPVELQCHNQDSLRHVTVKLDICILIYLDINIIDMSRSCQDYVSLAT